MKFSIKNISRKRVIKTLAITTLIIFLIPFVIYFKISRDYRPEIYANEDAIPSKYSALVLGAGIWKNQPSDILRDRLDAAIKLYKKGKVKKLILSGDNRFKDYDEPGVMKKYVLDAGIPEKDVQADYAGRRTYDSCYRAKNIFSQEEIIIVTQSFHITRAMFLCESIGLNPVGFISDTNKYYMHHWNWWKFRDVISLTFSLKDIYLWKPEVVGGEKIPV